ncbi:MAG: imidazoleglycerol-phosphate dehydratase, partial [Varibaculum cambriense]|nr:imidazoleglycerol-phosphate dehydratase [Varibaculum cambriense]
MSRSGKVTRKTAESDITVEIKLDGTGKSQISTGVPFYDHMLTALSKHSLIDMNIAARGDIEVDVHHT